MAAAKGCALFAALAFLFIAGAQANAQVAQTSANGQIVERGKFRFFDTKQPQGEESYEITREGRELILKTKLELESEDKISLSATHRELELFVKAGFTLLEAIQAATIVPARAMKLDKETGTVEKGKRADLIVLDANPLESISNIRKVTSVIARGRVFDCSALWRAAGFQP